MASVELKKVSKSFEDGTEALRDVSMRVEDGEFAVMVGPSGCGKTTILRSIAGLEGISDGEILIGESVVNDLRPGDREISMVFQNYALFPHLSVFENIAFGLRARGHARADIDARVTEVAATLQLADLLNRKPAALSGGQLQRVAMGRALVREPSVLLMDEPLSNLDAQLRVEMRAELADTHKRLGTTTVYVTHDQVEAMTMGSRVAVLRSLSDAGGSNLQQIAEPRVLYMRPANVFVAGFIGSPPMNLCAIPATATGTEFELHLERGRSISVPHEVARQKGLENCIANGGTVIGLRPESLHLGDARHGVAVEVMVTQVEQLGAEAVVHGSPRASLCSTNVPALASTSSSGPQLSIAGSNASPAIRIRVPASRDVAVGEIVTVSAPVDALHFFNPVTGIAGLFAT